MWPGQEGSQHYRHQDRGRKKMDPCWSALPHFNNSLCGVINVFIWRLLLLTGRSFSSKATTSGVEKVNTNGGGWQQGFRQWLPSSQPAPLQSFPDASLPAQLWLVFCLSLFNTTPPSHQSFPRLLKDGKEAQGLFLCFTSSLSVSRCLFTASVAWVSPIGATGRLLKVMFDHLLTKIMTIQ